MDETFRDVARGAIASASGISQAINLGSESPVDVMAAVKLEALPVRVAIGRMTGKGACKDSVTRRQQERPGALVK